MGQGWGRCGCWWGRPPSSAPPPSPLDSRTSPPRSSSSSPATTSSAAMPAASLKSAAFHQGILRKHREGKLKRDISDYLTDIFIPQLPPGTKFTVVTIHVKWGKVKYYQLFRFTSDPSQFNQEVLKVSPSHCPQEKSLRGSGGWAQGGMFKAEQSGVTGLTGAISYLWENVYTLKDRVPRILVVFANIHAIKKEVFGLFSVSLPSAPSLRIGPRGGEMGRTTSEWAWTRSCTWPFPSTARTAALPAPRWRR